MHRTDVVMRGIASLVTLIATMSLLSHGEVLPLLVAGIGIVAVADLFRVRIVEGRASSLGLAPALGLAFLSERPALAIVAYAVGSTIASQMKRERIASATPLLALTAGAMAFELMPSAAIFDAAVVGTLPMPGVIAALCATLLVDSSLRVIRGTEPATRRRVLATLKALTPLHVAVASAAGLFALAEPVLGAWAYPLFLAPLAATQHAFSQLTEIRRTFGQTIDALSKIPEVAGYSRPGHSQRVAALCTEIAIELGEDSKHIEELTIAAQLHDIGRMRVPSPDLLLETPPVDVAKAGGDVVRATGVLPRVAVAIERQHEAYRGPDGRSDRTLPLASRIIRVASAFDELSAAGTGAIDATRAFERLDAQSGAAFDPRVVAALGAVIEARTIAASANVVQRSA